MPVYRHGKNRWRVRIWNAGSHQDKVVHGSKSDALAFEARWRVEIEARGAKEHRVAPRFSTFSVETYKPHAKAHLRASTWSARRYQLTELIGHFGELKLTSISASDIEAYKHRRLADGVKPISVNNELAVLSAVLAYARHLKVPVAVVEITKLPVVQKSRLVVWSVDQVGALLRSCASVSAGIVPLVMFLANTGCRRGEAITLRWSSVDLDARILRIESSDEWQPKSGHAREVPISDELLESLRALPRTSSHVFPSPLTGEPFAFWPKLQFDRARKLAGLQGGPHTLRHTFASHFLKKVPDLFLLARVLGHSDTRVTRLYSHLLPEHLLRARNAVQFALPVAVDAAPVKAPVDATVNAPGVQSAKETAARRWKVPARTVTR